MAKRNMTVKGFVSKASKPNVSAAAFLAEHREFLLTGEVSQVAAPILRKLDEKALLPTPALEAITKAVYDHWQQAEIAKGEKAMNREPAKPKNWVVTVYDRNGRVETRVNAKGESEDLIQGFELSQDADRWADRRLVEGSPDCYAVVQHSTMTTKDGDPLATVVMRGDAIERAFRAPKGAAMRKVGGSTSALSFRPTVKNHVSKFSHG